MDWSGKKERARIEALRDPRENEEWFQNLPEDMREEASRHWRGKQEQLLDLQLRAKNGAVHDMLRFGLLFALTDALAAAHSTPADWFVQLVVGALVGLVVVGLDAGRLLCILLASVAFGATLILTRGGIVPQHLFVWLFVMTGAAYFGIQREDHY